MSPRTSHLTTLSSIPQVARRLGICVNSTRTLIAKGELTAVRVGMRTVRIRDSEVEQYIARQAGAAADAEGGVQ